MFEQDEEALNLTLEMLKDKSLFELKAHHYKVFAAMPLMHAESKELVKNQKNTTER